MARPNSLLRTGRLVVRQEARALMELAEKMDTRFSQACEIILRTSGRVVVIGIGKSGHVGRKIAATLASTGTPAFFVHAGEAAHGDLGMIKTSDVVLAISNSGETPELIEIVPPLRKIGARVVAITGNAASSLGRMADVVVEAQVEREAGPLGLAPTTSSTVALVLGDALAMALVKARRFSRKDFADLHPGGQLGRILSE